MGFCLEKLSFRRERRGFFSVGWLPCACACRQERSPLAASSLSRRTALPTFPHRRRGRRLSSSPSPAESFVLLPLLPPPTDLSSPSPSRCASLRSSPPCLYDSWIFPRRLAVSLSPLPTFLSPTPFSSPSLPPSFNRISTPSLAVFPSPPRLPRRPTPAPSPSDSLTLSLGFPRRLSLSVPLSPSLSASVSLRIRRPLDATLVPIPSPSRRLSLLSHDLCRLPASTASSSPSPPTPSTSLPPLARLPSPSDSLALASLSDCLAVSLGLPRLPRR